MTSDILIELREFPSRNSSNFVIDDAMRRAAAEIERLRTRCEPCKSDFPKLQQELAEARRQLVEANAKLAALNLCEPGFLDRVIRERDDARNQLVIAKQHIGWLKQFVQGMTDANWKDMQLRAERQLETFSAAITDD